MDVYKRTKEWMLRRLQLSGHKAVDNVSDVIGINTFTSGALKYFRDCVCTYIRSDIYTRFKSTCCLKVSNMSKSSNRTRGMGEQSHVRAGFLNFADHSILNENFFSLLLVFSENNK